MKTIRSVDEMQAARRALEPASSVGFVPTMGAFHDGHVALFKAARARSHVVVASLFVNPAQFGDPADLAAYPRDEATDAAIAARAGVDWLFAPAVADIYPPGFATWVTVEGPAAGLESVARPGHFRGVATVCLKLFEIVQPTRVYLGQKDAQQVAVLKRLVRDFNLPLSVEVIPTVRDREGLALSSRNARLSADERRRAAVIPRAMEAGLAAWRAGSDPVPAARAALGDLDADYLEIADFDGQPTLVVAARVGATRLIDNVPLTANRPHRA